MFEADLDALLNLREMNFLRKGWWHASFDLALVFLTFWRYAKMFLCSCKSLFDAAVVTLKKVLSSNMVSPTTSDLSPASSITSRLAALIHATLGAEGARNNIEISVSQMWEDSPTPRPNQIDMKKNGRHTNCFSVSCAINSREPVGDSFLLVKSKYWAYEFIPMKNELNKTCTIELTPSFFQLSPWGRWWWEITRQEFWPI